ncbi:MAG TPA: NAD(+) synthase, partial [Methanocorpusculum sp.]|nr:NAD(+) synthase [Methanocorpusculum sp.]
AELCNSLGVQLITVPLNAVHQAFLATDHISSASPIFSGNIAARLRMMALYNIAAERNYLVCGTSNKTEYMIGYSTKWGDSAADIQPLLHLYKREIYEIAEDLSIPEEILKKAPSAGFFDGQTDESDIELTYDELDTALFNLELNDFIPKNEVEQRVLVLVKKNEHKRSLPISKFSLQQKI